MAVCACSADGVCVCARARARGSQVEQRSRSTNVASSKNFKGVIREERWCGAPREEEEEEESYLIKLPILGSMQPSVVQHRPDLRTVARQVSTAEPICAPPGSRRERGNEAWRALELKGVLSARTILSAYCDVGHAKICVAAFHGQCSYSGSEVRAINSTWRLSPNPFPSSQAQLCLLVLSVLCSPGSDGTRSPSSE